MHDHIFERETSKQKEIYQNEGYFDQSQLDAFVSQIRAVHKLKSRKILEIGVGNGFVSTFLKSCGYNVTTFDINQNLRPDVVGNIIDLDKYFNDNTFDLILCAEVLEHLPFEYFHHVLIKFRRITSKNIIITLPRSHRILLDCRIYLKTPLIKTLKINVFRRISDRRSIWDGHCWQIDYKKDYSLKKVRKIITDHFTITEDYTDKRVRHHQYFILEKQT